MIPQITKDGSYTFYSQEFNEAFHSFHGAKQEALIKFVEPTDIKEIAIKNNSIKILDICYGLGYNSASAIAEIKKVNPKCFIEIIALEISPEIPQQAIANNLISLWGEEITELLGELCTNLYVENFSTKGRLILGDARENIQQLVKEKLLVDAIFLDPFSPPKCPQLWTVEFINNVAKCLKPTGTLATYSCSAAVRTALYIAGLQITSTPGLGRKSPGTLASFCGKKIAPLSLQEREHLKTRAAIPYRDPNLNDIPEKIRQRRQKEQQNCNLESTSQWKKRWLKLNSEG